MKRKRYLLILAVLFIVWVIGFIIFDSFHHFSYSDWYILAPLLVIIPLLCLIRAYAAARRKRLLQVIAWLAPIAAITAGIILSFQSPTVLPYCVSAFDADRAQIEYAVSKFMQLPSNATYNHTLGEVPVVNTTIIAVHEMNESNPRHDCYEVIPGENYYVIAICPLLQTSMPKGILKDVPETVHHRNCLPEGANAQPNVNACLNRCTGSYVWLTTDQGNIASICIGEECEAHGEDGYQDVYP